MDDLFIAGARARDDVSDPVPGSNVFAISRWQVRREFRAPRQGAATDAAEGVHAVVSLAPPRLHSAVVNADDGEIRTIAFYAAFVRCSEELAASVRDVHGDPDATVYARPGFDLGHPLLSAPVVEMLGRAVPRLDGGWLLMCARVDLPSARNRDDDSVASLGGVSGDA